MLKITIISLITLILYVIIKQKSIEFSMIISITGGLLIILLCLDYLVDLIDYYSNLSSFINVDNGILKLSLKIIGVGFLTEFSSNLASDFGNSAIASKIVFGGKVVICIITLPVLKELVSLLFSFY